MQQIVESRAKRNQRLLGPLGVRTVLGRKELTKGTKLRVVTAVVTPTLTYTDVKLGLYRQGTRDTYSLYR